MRASNVFLGLGTLITVIGLAFLWRVATDGTVPDWVHEPTNPSGAVFVVTAGLVLLVVGWAGRQAEE